MSPNNGPPLDKIVLEMLSVLASHLPPAPAPPIPPPNVSVVSLTERLVGLGNHRGIEARGPFAVVALKGGRLDARVRFQLWAATPGEVDTATDALHGRLLAARNDLWSGGFLRVAAEETCQAEHILAQGAWRKTTNYKVLYEFRYEDTDGAESIIARIPIHSDPEVRNSMQRETTVITDEMARWDDQEAPALEVGASVRSSVRVTGIAVLAYLPAGWTGNRVTLARLSRVSTDPPTAYPKLADFHTAVTHPKAPDRHAQVTFASVADFLAVLQPAGDPIALGDWDEDGTPDLYRPASAAFLPPIRLETGEDFIRLSYQDSTLDAKAVVYLRAQVRRR